MGIHRRTAVVASIVFSAALPALAAARPRNIILFIADGAGPSHYTALSFQRGAKFRIGSMPVVGLATTPAANRAVTDSAAGATALATGHKGNYEAISIDEKGAPLPTVLERAERSGMATGIVTTAAFYDATPASFAAHAGHRDEFSTIVQQMLRSGAEVILGGGLQRFGRANVLPALDVAAKDTGYTVVTTPADVPAAAGSKLLGVFPSQLRDVDFAGARLAQLTQWALERLRSDPDGFFLMVEHEGTDSSSHQNNSSDALASLESFDDAVGAALDFAAAKGDTLVVVTSDHETGSLRITQTEQKLRWRMEWATTSHTASVVPVFAYGPGSEAFGGFMDNTDIGRKLIAFVTSSGDSARQGTR